MKKFWVNSIPYKKDIVIAALESGAEAVVIGDGKSETVRQFGKIKTVEKDGDIVPGKDVEFIDIAGKAGEDKAASIAADKIVVLQMLDWTIIPIENLLARRGANVMVEGALAAGAAGVSIGRNAFQHKKPEKMVAALCKMVHNSAGVEEALVTLKS